MAEFNEEEEGLDEGAAAGGKKRRLIGRIPGTFIRILKWVLMSVVLVSSMILISWLTFKISEGKRGNYLGSETAVSVQKNQAVKPPKLGWFTQLEKVQTRTADISPIMLTVKVNIGFDVEDNETQTELIQRQVKIQGQIRSFFAKKEEKELKNEELIARELRDQLNQLMNTERIRDISFSEFTLLQM